MCSLWFKIHERTSACVRLNTLNSRSLFLSFSRIRSCHFQLSVFFWKVIHSNQVSPLFYFIYYFIAIFTFFVSIILLHFFLYYYSITGFSPLFFVVKWCLHHIYYHGLYFAFFQVAPELSKITSEIVTEKHCLIKLISVSQWQEDNHWKLSLYLDASQIVNYLAEAENTEYQWNKGADTHCV